MQRKIDRGRDEEAVRRFVERLALDLVATGIPRMPARIYAALLVADEGRGTAADLAEFLRVSPAAVSGAVRYLTQVALITREREPGARRDHYRVTADQWYQAILQQDALITQWERTLREGLEAVGEDSQAAARLRETWEFLQLMREEIPILLEKWQARLAALRARG
ncbi:DNA-binding transcriptional regulator GbsR (MarR family) [Nonomuraea thailandensis]|uniref:DNA-binding transcriptional regulator GbsR (MarR family) n=1 Tax=Nonomuraea thailandensis TaxID=1188745 RepID=A0A9X2JZS2_9ACTN|nr:MarR family transcriptional regulator [Nonomuraea thailandensis]MCP2355582.1 DNA-binding transcriptional regulator GbsR (MarR family) [Nonomuraea thailandensis]